jgi:hypothetical protein
VPGDRLLKIYLSDHLAAMVGLLELANRSQRSNRGTPLGDYLEGLAREIDEDRRRLEDIIDAVGGTKALPKQAAVWLAEKVGRLKFNGQLTGYSPLSRLIEIEGLILGVEANAALWHSLRRVVESYPTAASFDFDSAIERARGQRAELASHHRLAAEEALKES